MKDKRTIQGWPGRRTSVVAFYEAT